MRALPHLETSRCLLRLPTLADVPGIVRYYLTNQEHLRPFEPFRPEGFLTEDWWRGKIPQWREEFVQDKSMRLLLFRRAEPSRVIGVLNFTDIARGCAQYCLLGYSLAHEFEGRGLMREGLRAAIDYAFHELKLHRVMANYMPRNQRSGVLLKRLGFVIEGVARDYILIQGRWEDHVLTSLTNPAWTP
jgi:ribosomal-protein-alanine N-acetyltransferase